MELTKLPPGTILEDTVTEEEWCILRAQPGEALGHAAGSVVYRVDFLGSKVPHTRVVYSWEIGGQHSSHRPFAVVKMPCDGKCLYDKIGPGSEPCMPECGGY